MKKDKRTAGQGGFEQRDMVLGKNGWKNKTWSRHTRTSKPRALPFPSDDALTLSLCITGLAEGAVPVRRSDLGRRRCYGNLLVERVSLEHILCMFSAHSPRISLYIITFQVSTGKSASLKLQSKGSSASGSSVGSW